MKALILSDLHQYSLKFFLNKLKYLPPKEDYDIVLIAGDFTITSDLVLIKEMINCFEKPAYFVLGNHDYYNYNVEKVDKYFLGKGYNLLCGNNKYEITHEGTTYTIIGGVGWSSFELYGKATKTLSQLVAKENISDFGLIEYKNKIITPFDYSFLHQKEFKYFSKFKKHPNTILITHFPMSRVCLDPFYEQEGYRKLNPYFINNKDMSGFKVCISGHTHTAVDTIDNYGCRHIINPYGYLKEASYDVTDNKLTRGNGFDSYKIVDFKSIFNS